MQPPKAVTLALLFLFVRAASPQIPPKCVDPNGNNGTCISIMECKNFNIDRDRKFAKDSICGYQGNLPEVCCAAVQPGNSISFQTNTEGATNKPNVVFTTPFINQITERTNVGQYTQESDGRPPNPNRPVATRVPVYATSLLPDTSVCGARNFEDSRIIGGDHVAIDEFLWMALLRKARGQQYINLCGGSLISTQYVLTAAHCIVQNVGPDKIKQVRLGEWDTQTENDCQDDVCSQRPVDVDIQETVVHPDYHTGIYLNDIALVRLAQPVNFTDWIKPVCLPLSDWTPIDESYTVSGWGKTEYGTESVIKRKVAIKRTTLDVCKATYAFLNSVSGEKVICAGGRENEDACSGDSGGPLVAAHEAAPHLWYLHGIVSAGPRQCGTEGRPSLYTKVSKYMRWIVENMRP